MSLDFLPKEIEDTIFNYVHQLKMKNVCDELKKGFFFCDNCHFNKQENFEIPFFQFCHSCNGRICEDCADYLWLNRETDKECECHDCNMTFAIVGIIEEIIGRNITDDEYGIVMELCIGDELGDLYSYLLYLSTEELDFSFDELILHLYNE